ncbi:MAG: 16S rRNA (adenine(1518)-N(6)/adenine(1519)-N(6))-dimethyltransferase RsmA [Betaproteobacteria bacterium]|nr:16S rRNA (adenine(1518)-N(6)/adenine(1519)-N(6))-dimethyltransferase RsmA [Betaproteobacteria bacterium]
MTAERTAGASRSHVPRKRFGQHFLADRSVIRKILDALAPTGGDNVLEIGPGLGALTEPLLERIPFLQVVEIDRDIVQRLRAAHEESRLRIHEGDALQFDFGIAGADLRVVGNLPYNISTPLLFRLAQWRARIRDCHFMLQKEVVDRMVDHPGGPDYGRLSVMLQYRFRMEKLFEVPPGAFRPPPKVRSAVVRMTPLGPEAPVALDEQALGEVVTRAFTRRRKTLRNALEGYLDVPRIEAAGLDPASRPETVDVGGFIRAADEYVRRRAIAE